MKRHKDITESQYVNPRQFAERQGISRQRVMQLIQEGRIAGCKRVGVMWLIPLHAQIIRN